MEDATLKSADECRAKAKECRKLAETAIDPKTRSHWLHLAKTWDATAAEAAAQEALAEVVEELENGKPVSDA